MEDTCGKPEIKVAVLSIFVISVWTVHEGKRFFLFSHSPSSALDAENMACVFS